MPSNQEQTEDLRLGQISAIERHPALIPGGRALDEQHRYRRQRIVGQCDIRGVQGPCNDTRELHATPFRWPDDEGRRICNAPAERRCAEKACAAPGSAACFSARRLLARFYFVAIWI